jgi:outer membrane protein assembly factor BamE (lipoprotein component of BamABCDE complex)
MSKRIFAQIDKFIENEPDLKIDDLNNKYGPPVFESMFNKDIVYYASHTSSYLNFNPRETKQLIVLKITLDNKNIVQNVQKYTEKNAKNIHISNMNTNNDMYSDSDSDYMPPKRSKKKQRRNSEGDIVDLKIKQRSRSDSYFKSQSKENQIAYLNKEQEISNFLDETIPIRYKILNSSLSINIKSLVINKINIYENMNQEDNEYTKLNKWINGLSKIPFDYFVRLPISIQDGNSKIQNFLLQSFTILKETIYGQNEAKNKIMQIIEILL